MTSLTDSFVEAAPPVLLSAHTGPAGVTYTKGLGTGNLTIATSGQLSATANETLIFYYASTVPDGTAQTISCTYVINNAGKTGPGIWWFADTTGANGYHVAYYGGTWILYKRVGSSFTSLATWVNSATGTFTVVVTAGVGSQSVTINGTLRLSATDGALTAKGRWGLGAANDDATTQIYISTWSAADVGGSGRVKPWVPQLRGGMRNLSGGMS